MKVLVSRQGWEGKVPRELVRSVLQKVFEIAGREGEVSVLVVDDREMRRLNLEYRHIDSSTDVLSFALNEGSDLDLHPEMLGDIVVSMETAARQAAESGRPMEKELSWLLVHGALHLLGYDHERSQKEAAAMRELEKRILDHLP